MTTNRLKFSHTLIIANAWLLAIPLESLPNRVNGAGRWILKLRERGLVEK